mmetsp:Transcript_13602/g.38935  ORF Transcript_13602/g.38935 Transcript_13602/m.38935 type:complete len:533 (+) Transcript_13602:2476-4074(+)
MHLALTNAIVDEPPGQRADRHPLLRQLRLLERGGGVAQEVQLPQRRAPREHPHELHGAGRVAHADGASRNRLHGDRDVHEAPAQVVHEGRDDRPQLHRRAGAAWVVLRWARGVAEQEFFHRRLARGHEPHVGRHLRRGPIRTSEWRELLELTLLDHAKLGPVEATGLARCDGLDCRVALQPQAELLEHLVPFHVVIARAQREACTLQGRVLDHCLHKQVRPLQIDRQQCAVQLLQGLRILHIPRQLADAVFAEQVLRHIEVLYAVVAAEPLLEEDEVVVVHPPVWQMHDLDGARPEQLEIYSRLRLVLPHGVHESDGALRVAQQALRERLGAILFHVVSTEVQRRQGRVEAEEVGEEDRADDLDAIHPMVVFEAGQIQGGDLVVSQVFQWDTVAVLQVQVLFLHRLHEAPAELGIETIPPQVEVGNVGHGQDQGGNRVLRKLRAEQVDLFELHWGVAEGQVQAGRHHVRGARRLRGLLASVTATSAMCPSGHPSVARSGRGRRPAARSGRGRVRGGVRGKRVHGPRRHKGRR